METKDFFENFAREGLKDHDTANVPFFRQAFSDEEAVRNKEEVEDLLNAINSKFPSEYVGFPKELLDIYKFVGQINIECNFDCWILKSLEGLNERLDIYLTENQHFVVDFAIRYMGMGHIIVAAFDPRDGRIFYRGDGGSNGWDRAENWNTVKSLNPRPDQKFEFSHWKQEVIKPKIEGPSREMPFTVIGF